MRELTGQSLGHETIRRLTTRMGALAAAQEEQVAAQIERWEPPPASAQRERLYTAVMVRLQQGFKEAQTVVCYGEQTPGQPTRRCAVRLEPAEQFRAHAWATACQHGLPRATEKVLLGDGAAWIWDHVGAVLGEDVTHIVDWYHATEHVWNCGKALYGEGTEPTKTWVESIKTLLHEGNIRGVLARLNEEYAQRRGKQPRAALSGLMTYLSNQDDRLAYDRFRARGLDIGSGQVESACKSVVAARMKRSGMRWSASGAQAVLSLRCVWLNGDWG